MTILSGRITITPAATLIVPEPKDKGGYTVIITNLGPKKVYLDGPTVSISSGFELPNNQTVTVPVAPDEGLYGITAAGESTNICYLVSKR